MGQNNCPLCGAEPQHHRQDAECDGDITAVVTAAPSEIGKIELLRKELGETVTGLQAEARRFDGRLPGLREELASISDDLDRLVGPRLSPSARRILILLTN